MENRVVGLILRTIVTATLFFGLWILLNRVILRDRSPLITGLVTATIFAGLTEASVDARKRRERAGLPAIPPMILIGIGVAALAFFAWWGMHLDPRPTGSEFWLLLVLMIPPLYLLYCGIAQLRAQRRGSQQNQIPN